MEELPIINISELSPLTCDLDTIFEQDNTKILAQSFFDALSSFGFLYLTGHGISEATVEDAFQAMRDFFDPKNRDIHIKHYRRRGVYVGYMDCLNEPGNHKEGNPVDLKQAYDLTLNSTEFSVIPDEQKPPLRKLYRNFERLSQFMMRFLALSLGHDIDYFLRGHQKMGDIEKNSATMRLNYYKGIGAGMTEEETRLSEHTDYGTFTLLVQDQTGGLQVHVFL